MNNATGDLNATLQAFDDINSQDPNLDVDQAGKQRPKELLYAERMSAELADFTVSPSDELQLAARAQHIERWAIPRSDYPMDRAGYKRWRVTLGQHHAQRACDIMREHGYSEESCERVATMLQKKQLKRDAEVQMLEDVICLVFIRYHLESFATKHPETKLITIINKTWHKMSTAGQARALTIQLPTHLQSLIKKALQAG
ncbi:DUF4202 domain-containing protein [Gilvimarinus polysaccharolyticus]|uniref:DUF4202 domain-containing protein n=1 Tax=Gilvimarinus polysaccharolyticus TaxID=863921 RepID=UPI00067348AD|nr:DUF4202 domain-containing protein [Gilvimarinus polysaccharolyticus]